MTTIAVFQDNLHDIPFEARAYMNTVDHLIQQYHGDQIRDDGAPYTNHVRDVMRQILELERKCRGEVDWGTVIAGGCHDLIEDSYSRPVPVTPEIIARAFGQHDRVFGVKVAWLVTVVSKLPRKNFPTKEARLEEYYNRLFRSAEEDYRVLLVKYPDRNHNLATLHGLTATDPSKVQRMAQETLDIYIPKGRECAIRLLPDCYHQDFLHMLDRMERLALAYLVQEYSVSYHKNLS